MTVSFKFNLQRVEGKGEDAEPIVREGRNLGLVAVFDGMGGAGGTEYATAEGPRTGAYLASRVAREVVERRMLELLDPEWSLDGVQAATALRDAVRQALRDALTGLQAPRSGLRSKLLRALPTTMALAALQRHEPGGPDWDCHVLWAGDSRVYAVSPDEGMRQLSVDDIRDRNDAMTNLTADSVVDNAMSADTDFGVRHARVELRAPCLLLAASDGCFGYVRSPMHFEHLLLSTLVAAPGTSAWSAALLSRVGEVAGDDASMALLGLGGDHAELQAAFAARAARVEREWVAPLDALAEEVRRAEQALTQAQRCLKEGTRELWSSYRPGYEGLLSAGPAAAAAPDAPDAPAGPDEPDVPDALAGFDEPDAPAEPTAPVAGEAVAS